MNYIIRNGELYRVDELAHHGIKGQKWGVRRYQNADGTLTAAGKKRVKQTRYGADKNAKKATPSIDHDKTSSKLPLLSLATDIALAAVNGNLIAAGSAAVRLGQAAKSAIKSKLYDEEREGCETDKKTGFLLKKETMTSKQDADRVNPSVHNFDENTKNNCMMCTCAYDLRRRGYEVQAKTTTIGFLSFEVKKWYPKAKINQVNGVNEKGKASTKAMMTQLKNELVKQGDGARGNLMIRWKGTGGGHSVAYEIQNGKLCIIDAQIGKVYNNPDTLLSKCAASVQYVRLDNTEFNAKNIKEVVK